jgi:hypothetical protein
MPSPEFPAQFIEELAGILRSEAVTQYYDHDDRPGRTATSPFTGEWRLESLGFAPGTGRRRVVASFTGGDKVVEALMDADDFPNLLHGEHDPAFNSTPRSDLAYYISILLMEQILTMNPDTVQAGDVCIAPPA